jgi:hypothetical protein
MKIQNWKGLVSAASPYAIKPGAATIQNNLQVRKPGQLVPRPGLSPLPQPEQRGFQTILSIHRSSAGQEALSSFYYKPSPSQGASGNVQPDEYLLERITVDQAGNLQTAGLFSTTTKPYGRPSFCEDRNGTMYVFFGNGIRPIAFRPRFDTTAVDFGLDAPTAAPSVTPNGDGWFIERVDVLASGTSYYTAPVVTVTGGSPDRNATLRAVVQAGAIVAIDVVDGGSNFKEVPSITLSNEQVGIGFSGRGIQQITAAVFGFLGTAAPALTGTGPTPPRTHAYNLTTTTPTIAYKDGSATKFVPATFSTVTGLYTAVLPLTTLTGPGSGAFATISFAANAAAGFLGDVSPNAPTGATVPGSVFTTIVATGLTAFPIQFRHALVGWSTFSGTYFENTYSPAQSGYGERTTTAHEANRDSFWTLGPMARRYRFVKSQPYLIYYTRNSVAQKQYSWNWADYYFPDYSQISYYALTGPESGFANQANWTLLNSPVQLDANNKPFIDVTLFPAKKADGTSYALQPGSQFPVLRFYLAFAPETWTVNNTLDQNPDTWARKYQPYNGQDRVQNFNDLPVPLHSNNAQDTWTRWYSIGHTPNFPMPFPIVDFRQSESASNTTYGITADSVVVINRGTLLEPDTKFAVRFYQYNAVSYRIWDRWQDFTWLNGIAESRKYDFLTQEEWNANTRAAWGTVYADFYLQANALDSSASGLSLLRPGPVPSLNNVRATISGTGWTNNNQTAAVTLRHRPDTGPESGDDPAVPFIDGQTFTFSTTTLVPQTSQKRIASVQILSGGQNYYREPTILFSGGGGYGLRLGATVADGKVASVAVLDGGDGFTSDTLLFTDVQPAKLLPVLRGTMRGTYRCAYRFADYRQTVVLRTTFSAGYTTGPGGAFEFPTTIELSDTTGVKPGMVITGSDILPHMVKIVSLQGNTATLSQAATGVVSNGQCVIRDMNQPITYSDFSPIVDVDASASGSGRASTLQWVLSGVNAPGRADHVEFFRTSADQSLVFYRLEIYGTVEGGVITIPSNSDGLSDEELFDIDRPGYAALPVVLPNGGVNAFRFGVPRSDMAVAVAWQDRLWYGVSTSGEDVNTVFFSEFDEFESCPDVNDLPVQANLRTTDFLTALVPFGSVLMAMQNSHAYTITFNTDPGLDAAITLAAHRGALSQQCWDFYDEMLYIADERGIYSMDKSGNVESLSEAIRDFFDEGLLDFSERENFFLKVDHSTGILRLFAVKAGSGAEYPHFCLCYHIRNQAWWTETWPTSLTAAADFRRPGLPDRPVYGAVEGSLFLMEGLTDRPNRNIVSVTITNPGSGYIEPPAITAVGDGAAEFQAVIRDGQLTDILILYGGWGYGTDQTDPLDASLVIFNPNVALVIEPPPSGTPATATALARNPLGALDANNNPIPFRSTVPWRMRTGPMELIHDGKGRGGDAEMSRSITVTYRPTPSPSILNLREYYNNSPSPRPNVMRRDRGTGFVHDTTGSKTTLDMAAARTALGLSTGLATAQFAGRSLSDLSSADRHLAVELSCDPVDDNAAVSIATEPLLYSLEVNGVADGGQ